MMETRIESAGWSDLDFAPLADAAARAALSHLGYDPDDCIVSILGSDDARIALLNARYRDKSTATNVLSWPAQSLAPAGPGQKPPPPEPDPFGEIELGDLMLAYETCAAEAATGGIPLADHLRHLVVHGTLHLLGYDHIEEADGDLMEAIETEILATLGVRDPYRAI